MTKTIGAVLDSTISRKKLDDYVNSEHIIFDIIIKEKINSLFIENSKVSIKNTKVFEYVKALKNMTSQSSIFKLEMLYFFGMTSDNINKLMNAYNSDDINNLFKISGNRFDELKLTYYLKNKIPNVKKEILQEMKSDKGYFEEAILFYLFKKKSVKISTFINDIREYIDNNCMFLKTYNIDLVETVDMLVKHRYILTVNDEYVFPPNIFYDVNIPLSARQSYDYIFNFDFVYKEVLEKRINGRTLVEIGKELGISREAIRQRQSKLKFLFNETKEFHKYKRFFEKYKLNEETFCSLFDENSKVFNLLSIICEKGEKPIVNREELLKDISDDGLQVSADKVNKLFEEPKKPEKRTTKREAVQEFLNNHREITYNAHDFIISYNSIHNEKLQINNEGSVLGIVSDLRDVISGSNKTFRFFDFSDKENMAFYIYDAINGYKDGEYSAYKIFKENPVLMMNLDVNNEYELHNFIKRNQDKFYGFKLAKAPMILKGFNNKKEFTDYELSISAGMTTECFVRRIFEEYGLKKSSFRSYVEANFKEYIYDGTILDLNKTYDDELIESIRNKMKDEIYGLSEFCELVNIDENDITNELLNEINYCQRGEFLYSGKFDSLASAVQNLIFKNDEKFYKICEEPSIKRCIFSLESNMKVFELSYNKLCTIDNLKQKGFIESDINDFINKVASVSKDKRYFTIGSIYNDLNGNKLFDYAFMENFYDAVIGFSGKFTVLRKNLNNNVRLYTNEDGSIDDFIRTELDLIGGKAYMQDFIDYIYDKYDMEISEQMVENHVEKYANALDKIYNDKIDYYKDIE